LIDIVFSFGLLLIKKPVLLKGSSGTITCLLFSVVDWVELAASLP